MKNIITLVTREITPRELTLLPYCQENRIYKKTFRQEYDELIKFYQKTVKWKIR